MYVSISHHILSKSDGKLWKILAKFDYTRGKAWLSPYRFPRDSELHNCIKWVSPCGISRKFDRRFSHGGCTAGRTGLINSGVLLLGAFAKLQNETVSFAMSVSVSVHPSVRFFIGLVRYLSFRYGCNWEDIFSDAFSISFYIWWMISCNMQRSGTFSISYIRISTINPLKTKRRIL